jgi:PAS domain S-box-containing protein
MIVNQRNQWMNRLAIAPIPMMALAIVSLWVADVRVVWASQSMTWLIHYGSVALGFLFIVIPAARSFLANGEPSVLMLGCGILIMDIGVTAMPFTFARSSDTAFAIYNTSALLGALCHFMGVAVTSRRKIRLKRPIAWLTAAYAGGAAVMGLVICVAFAGWMPVFFIDDQGGTVVRSLVVSTAVALFVLTAGLLWQTNRRIASPFLRWYSLGLFLLAAGLAGSMLIVVRDSPLQWVARFTQIIGTIYMCVAVLASARKSITKAIPLSAVEKAWRENDFLASLRQQSPLGWVLRYGLAVVAVAAAFGVRVALTAWVGPGLASYITFYPAVMVAALLAGFGPGLLATALAGLIAAYRLMPPVGQHVIASPADRLGLVIFTSMGLFVSVVAEFYRHYRDKAAAYDSEAALRENQARLAVFAEATFEGIVESEAGRIVDCNEQFARMFGYSVAELRGFEIVKMVAPEDVDRVMANIRQGLESASEHVALRKDGSRINVEVHGRPASPGSARRHTAIRDITARKRAEEALIRLNAEQEVANKALRDSRAAALNLMQDAVAAHRQIEQASEELRLEITERKRAESALQTTLQRFYDVLSSMYSGVLLVTDEGRVEFANQAFCDGFGLEDAPTDLLGLTSEDMLEKIKNAYLHSDESMARIREIVDRGQPVKGEELAMRDGRTCLRDYVPLNIHGKSYGRLWLHFDITERKRAEETLRRHSAELQAMNDELARFNRVAVGRELRMIELKKEINALYAQLGQPPPYPLEFEKEEYS